MMLEENKAEFDLVFLHSAASLREAGGVTVQVGGFAQVCLF